MLKRFFCLLSACLLALPFPALSELEEDELLIEEIIELPEEEEPAVVPDTDGSFEITVTCTGDFTIGGDNFHNKGKKFYSELSKHNNDINFTMQNMRSILEQDDMTLVNFEGTFTNTKHVPDSKKGKKEKFIVAISMKYHYNNYIIK